jgi:Ca2+:H+ antiporter
LRAGLTDLVKASLTGSIIGNVLLVFGAAALYWRPASSRAAIQSHGRRDWAPRCCCSAPSGSVIPAVFHRLSRGTPNAPELELDTEIAVVLFVTYCASLVFTLKTHRGLYGLPARGKASPALAGAKPDHVAPGRSVSNALLMLLAATVGVAIVSELLVGSVTEAAKALGMSELFVGVVVVALVGNAAEHYSAIAMAAEDKMDAAIAIAIGSSTQIRALRGAGPGVPQLSDCAGTDESAVHDVRDRCDLAGRTQHRIHRA